MKKQYINPLTTAMAVVSNTIICTSSVQGQIGTNKTDPMQSGSGDAPARNTLITGPIF